MAAPWRDIGVVLYELRDVKRAGIAFEQYLELAPDSPEAPKIRAFREVLKEQWRSASRRSASPPPRKTLMK
jgi:regulator of sirC expression with transglutaminase-like and TPR domain